MIGAIVNGRSVEVLSGMLCVVVNDFDAVYVRCWAVDGAPWRADPTVGFLCLFFGGEIVSFSSCARW